MNTIKTLIIATILLFCISSPNGCQATKESGKSGTSGSIRPTSEHEQTGGSIRPNPNETAGGSIRPNPSETAGGSIRDIPSETAGGSIRPSVGHEIAHGSMRDIPVGQQQESASRSIRPRTLLATAVHSGSIRTAGVESAGSGSIRTAFDQTVGHSSIRDIPSGHAGTEVVGSIRPESSIPSAAAAPGGSIRRETLGGIESSRIIGKRPIDLMPPPRQNLPVQMQNELTFGNFLNEMKSMDEELAANKQTLHEMREKNNMQGMSLNQLDTILTKFQTKIAEVDSEYQMKKQAYQHEMHEMNNRRNGLALEIAELEARRLQLLTEVDALEKRKYDLIKEEPF